MYHDHRKRLLTHFPDNKNHLIYLKGGSVLHRYNTDFEYPFRQESNFLYLTGADEPDMAAFFHCDTGEYFLVIPRRSAQYAVWMGYVHSPEEYRAKYQPDQVLYNDEVDAWLEKIRPAKIHCLPDAKGDVRSFGFPIQTSRLKYTLAYCRVIKSRGEIDHLKKAAAVANQAHLELMKNIRPGAFEYEMKALFEHHATRHGLVHAPYSGIFASGRGSAILHYTENRKMLESGDLFLVDAGAEYKGYAADITRTYPVNGRFTNEQADLYDIVLEALNISLNKLRPGKKMEDLHLASARVILEGLRNLNLVSGDIDAMMEDNVFALFFPHGLGHFLGLDTHDTGGYPKGKKKIDRPGIRHLRTRRTFETGMVLTIEPGLYFIPALLKPAFEDDRMNRYLNRESLMGLMDFGGIRIEDNVIVCDDGIENLTTVPKIRQELEHLIL